ncbi:Panacea domain-containing protein [Corynebacterium tuberculostearicum]|uniref:Panacea domain-containing protein n=1 Tax=Corynebacterium tuberculostearicum TaxID=38304 RepID=UPI002649120A|nr:type II toxin-antitoxin system antitoxin SocA domain-containing protein [Corynebacterium tuberculostearicum]
MIANNILTRAFAEKSYLTPMKLQKILYFVASEYQKATSRTLLEEPFSTWAYGPVVYSVYDEFRGFSKENIKRYARDALGNVFVIDESQDIELKVALDRVWHKTKDIGAVRLSEITHSKDSAWDKAFQKDHAVLDPVDISADNTYRVPLGLEAGV